MTLVAAWERQTAEGPELVFAADSRLRQGGEWDTCPKIFVLPRGDALLAFAGDTLWTYPIVLQTIAAMNAFEPSRERRFPLNRAKAHIMRTINDMMVRGTAPLSELHNAIRFEFLFGGWSWRTQGFQLWRLYWHAQHKCMDFDPIEDAASGRVAFIGDRASAGGPNVVGDAKRRLTSALRKAHGELRRGLPLDMEPWQVIVDMLRERSHTTIGGAPQLAKTYPHLNSLIFPVYWPDSKGPLTLGGRQLLDYEHVDIAGVNPDDPFPNRRRNT